MRLKEKEERKVVIQKVSLEELQKNLPLFKELIRAYQEIFGDSDGWGEGAYCDKEGWSRLISLSEYRHRLMEKRLLCDCGGKFLACYPSRALKRRIIRELTPSDNENPICILMKEAGTNHVVGFFWGVITSLENIVERILLSSCQKREKGIMKIIDELKNSLNSLDDKQNILFGDEIAILKEFRKGIEPLAGLARMFFEHGIEYDCHQLVFWSSKESSICKLAIRIGFQKIYESNNGTIFLFHKDFSSFLDLLRKAKIPAIAVIRTYKTKMLEK